MRAESRSHWRQTSLTASQRRASSDINRRLWLRVKRGKTYMLPDDELCLCFHVSQRKVVNFIRVEKPKRPAQLSECFGAGTGCGWCRPFLERLFEEAVLGGETHVD